MSVWRRGRYGRIIGGTRVLELAAQSQEASQGRHSLDVDELAHVEPELAERGEHNTNT
jgi:hypothetical protein